MKALGTVRGHIHAALGNVSTFALWIAVLVAAFAEPLSVDEREILAAVIGGRKLPSKRVRELWIIAGRRGGKSRMAALLAVYIACCCDHADKLVAGEIGHVLVLAASKEQARVVFHYILGFLEASPAFAALIEDQTSEEIRLTGNIIISTHAANFKTVRGRTVLAAICDESAYWRDETSAQPDVEIVRALLPSIIAAGGLLIGISSAYRRAGLLYQKFQSHFGKDDDDILVVRGTSLQFNPTLDAELIAKAHEDDEESAKAEWDSEFRSDLSQFLDDEDVDAAVNENRASELKPNLSKSYKAFVDASGGRHDGYVVAIGHREDNRIVVDCIRRKNPPFNPADTTEEFAELVKDYGIKEVSGDNFAAEWCSTAWELHGLRYAKAEKPKSQLYLDGLPAFTRRQLEIPNDATLIRELRMLERRTSRSGRDSVSDPPGNSTHDDSANALFGLIHLLRERRPEARMTISHWEMMA